MRLRLDQSSRPCANGNSMTSLTCGMARYTGATHGSAATLSRSPRAAKRASKGSVITASPIHCGAMTRLFTALWFARDSMRANDFAGLQLVDRAAVRALAFAGRPHIDEHARVAAPQRHLRVRAEHDAGTRHVFGRHFDGRGRVAHC